MCIHDICIPKDHILNNLYFYTIKEMTCVTNENQPFLL